MKLNNSGLKQFKVSILLMKNSFLKNLPKTEKKINKKVADFKNLSNFHSKNNKHQYKFNKIFSKTNDKSLGFDTYRNIKVQTALSSSYKKFRTPYQKLHFKNKMLKDIFGSSKNSLQNSDIEKQINEKIIDIRPYSTGIKIKREEKILTPRLYLVKLNKNKNNEKDIFKKILKKNKTTNSHLLSEITNSFSQSFINNNYNNYNKPNLTNRKEYKSKKRINIFKIFKPNCYYNKLNLEKLSSILRKYSYADI